MKVFADFEYNGQPNLETIQFGVIVTDDNCNVISTYNSLVHPILPITSYVEKLTKINNEDVEKADDFSTVFASFILWLHSHSNSHKLTFYAWGEDWKQFRRECKKRKCLDKFEEMMSGNERVNYQKKLSREIQYKGKMMTKSMRLDDVKRLYSIPNEVSHDALSDAFDLLNVYKAVEIDKKEYLDEELRRIFQEKQPHMKRMKEYNEKKTYYMFKDLISLGEFAIDIDTALFRKLKSGPGEFFNDIENMIGDESVFSKKRECVYINESVKLKIKILNDNDKIFVKYKVAYYPLPDKNGEFQFEITEQNRRFVSRILHTHYPVIREENA